MRSVCRLAHRAAYAVPNLIDVDHDDDDDDNNNSDDNDDDVDDGDDKSDDNDDNCADLPSRMNQLVNPHTGPLHIRSASKVGQN